MIFLLCGVAGTTLASAPEHTFFTTASCVDCHDEDSKKGGLDLTTFTWNPSDPANLLKWEKLYDRVDRGEMPPPPKAKPDAAAVAQFLTSVRKPLTAVRQSQQAANGRVGVRRLNRAEYENSVHALLAIDAPLQQVLPEDGGGQEFDTVADGLRFSQLQIEKYLEAADLAIDAALNVAPPLESELRRFTLLEEKAILENLETEQGKPKPDNPKDKHQVLFRKLADGVAFFADTYQLMLDNSKVERTGNYTFRLSGYGFQSRSQPVTLIVMADNHQRRRILATFELSPDQARVITVTARMERGERIRIAPHGTNYNDAGKQNWGIDAALYDGIGLAVQWMEMEGPLADAWPPQSILRIAGDVPRKEYPKGKQPWRNGRQVGFDLEPVDPAATLAAHLPIVAARAFRRPVSAADVDPVVRLALQSLQQGASFSDALRVGLKAILVSPQFLLFDEARGLLTAYPLANRLSYFLTSSPPDAELLSLADSGAILQPEILRQQIRRLVKAPASNAFVTNFTGQWLNLRAIEATSPDAKLYPEFDDVLKRSMVGETEAFFARILRENRPVTEFIHSDWVMINRRLGTHYEIPGALTEAFTPVSLPPNHPRGGLLTQAAILKVTANGTTTSPVVRGTWVMKRLLGKPPAPPPPVPAIEPDTRGAVTVRELLDKHRSSETCNACHRNIDPPGFALESFDVIGGYRDRYRSIEKGDRAPGTLRGQGIWQYRVSLPVDASGQLPNGAAFRDIREFKQLLLQQSDTVLAAIAGKLLVYGSGASLDFADRQVVQQIVTKAKAQGGGLLTLLEEVILSEAFRSK
jgi:hypothetical protein